METKYSLWGRILLSVASVLILLADGCLPAYSEEARPPADDRPVIDFSFSPLSKYVWRGQELSKDSIVIQPSLTVGYKGFSVNMWGNLDTKPYAAAGKSYSGTWTETDFSLSWNKTIGAVTAGIGYIYYNLAAAHAEAQDPLDSQEVFLTLTLDKLLSPTLSIYKEIDHYHQWYFLLGISHTIELGRIVALKLAASASYLLSDDAATYPKYDSQSNQTDDKYSNFHDAQLTASLPIYVAKSITFTPLLSYVFPLCEDAKYDMKARSQKVTGGGAIPLDGDSSYLYGGLTVSFTY
jgi:hypothetical protein